MSGKPRMTAPPTPTTTARFATAPPTPTTALAPPAPTTTAGA